MGIMEFLAGMFGGRPVEVVAALLGLVNVVLIVRRSLWNYPFGIVMVLLYGWIFFEARLYSDALLQVFFLVIQLFGIAWWLKGRDTDGLVVPRQLPAPAFGLVGGAIAAGTLALGWVMANFTDAALPVWNAFTAAASVAAQWLMARRFVQGWLVWIVVDVVSIGVYLASGLAPTAVLYTVFLGLAVAGWLGWRRAMAAGEAVMA